MTDTPAVRGPWRRWAKRSERETWWGFFHASMSIWDSDGTAVEVDLHEDPDGSHYGWLDHHDNKLSMVQPTKMQFEMQSPDFFRRDIAEGRGRVLRLRVEPVYIPTGDT